MLPYGNNAFIATRHILLSRRHSIGNIAGYSGLANYINYRGDDRWGQTKRSIHRPKCRLCGLQPRVRTGIWCPGRTTHARSIKYARASCGGDYSNNRWLTIGFCRFARPDDKPGTGAGITT